jgi:DNA-binding MarR family transcriptional regulator
MARRHSEDAEPIQIDRVIHEPARLVITAHLYVVESADYVYLMQNTNLTWGNLSSHLSRLEEAGYVEITKEFVNRKPHTMVSLTADGRAAFDAYRHQMKALFDDLPDSAHETPSKKRR